MSEDYTREEALAVSESSSLRELVAEAFLSAIRVTNFQAVLLVIRQRHQGEGAPGRGWLCVVGESGDDHRCGDCQLIDRAFASQTILGAMPLPPPPGTETGKS